VERQRLVRGRAGAEPRVHPTDELRCAGCRERSRLSRAPARSITQAVKDSLAARLRELL
jgi:hypothetical protein